MYNYLTTTQGREQELPRVLNVAEVADILRVSRTTVYEAVKDGVIPAIRMGTRIVIPREAFERGLRSCGWENAAQPELSIDKYL